MTERIPPPEGEWVQATVAQRHDDGWTAITDAGVEISLPERAVRGFRLVRPGQRLRLRLPHPDAATAEEATPLPFR